MWQRFLRRARVPVLVAAGLFVLYLLAGFFLVGPLAQRALPWVGEKALASRLSAQRIAFNPLTLELRVEGLALAEPDGALLAGFDRLYVNLDAAGLARWAWRIRTLQVQQPRLRIEVRRGGALNWGRLIARVRERMGPPSDRIPRLLLDHLAVADGEIVMIDGNRQGDAYREVFAPLGLTLDGLSTLPEDRGGYLLAAKLSEQGGTLRWKGDVSLNPLNSQGELSLEGARMSRVLRALAPALAADASGRMSVALRYRFALLRTHEGADLPSLQVSNASATVHDFALTPRGSSTPLLKLAEARVSDIAFDLQQRELRVGAVGLSGGQVIATRDAQGRIDWTTLAAPSDAAPGAAAPWKVSVHDFRLQDWSARWTDQAYARPLMVAADGIALAAGVAGELGGATTRLALEPVEASAGPVQVTSGPEPVAQLRRVALTGASAAVPGNHVRVESVLLTGGRTVVALDQDHRLNWAEFLRRLDAPSAPPSNNAAPLDLEVGRIAAEDLQLQWTDASQAHPVTLDVVDGAVTLEGVGLDPDRAIPLDARFSLRQGGRFEARGSIVPGKPSGQLELRLADLALRPLAPYVEALAPLRLDSGAVATQGKLTFAPGAKSMQVAFKGGFAIDNLALAEQDTGQPFAGWKKLSSDSVQLTLAPDRLHIGELVALKPSGKVIIEQDRTLNLQHLRRAGSAPAPAASTPDAPPFPVTVDRLRIVDADAQFADLTLTPQFGTRMQQLGGVVTGLSTDPTSVAQVELDGKVEDYGSARIRGTLQPFHATDFTDVTLAFRNLEMTRLTPYSGKFAGRKIESGRMSVDLEYKVKQRQLAGTNKFVVNKLRLGEPVASPDAVKLPLDLAIAVLEDSNGVIDLDLPVTGSLDDPQFSYGALVWKAIVNVLTRIVTAPFRALGAMLGVNAEKMDSAGFDPGSSTLLPPEQEKLKVLADALARRPSLTVTIQPGYDPESDRRALQEAAMRRDAAAAAGTELAAGEAPGPVDVNLYKVRTWLEDRYVQQAGRAAYEQLRAKYRDPGEGAVARAMDTQFLERLGRQFKARDSGPPSALHAELLEHLTQQVPVADDALVALGRARAEAMHDAMVKLGVPADRVTVAAPEPRAAKDKLVGSGLALGTGKVPAPAAPAVAGR